MNVSLHGAGIRLDGLQDAPFELSANWLRSVSAKSDLYETKSHGWTDGANFHPQDVAFDVERAVVNVALAGHWLELVWSDGTRTGIALDQLLVHLERDPLAALCRRPWLRPAEWSEVGFEQLMSDDTSLLEMLNALVRDGVVTVRDVPACVTSAPALATRMGGLERSHLGETFRVHHQANSTHIGEEMGEIPLHIDLVYRQRPPDYQVLHALTQVVAGGENIFVDVEHVVALLTPAETELLQSVELDFVALSETVHFRGRHPVLSIDPDKRLRVAYNQYKMQFPHGTPPEYFGAFASFQKHIHQSTNQVEFLLREGSAVLFDNRRVLHGRRAFDDPRRDVIGCFAAGDDVRSRLRGLIAASQHYEK